MKYIFRTVVKLLLLISLISTSHAGLTTIGSAGYDADNSGIVETDEHFNLIWDNDNNGRSVVWFDFSNPAAVWQDQVNWAASLGSNLTVNLDAGYKSSTDWTSGWRLPATVDGTYLEGYNGSTTAGWNITSSEMGHLFYLYLKNKGHRTASGGYNQNQGGPDYFLQYTGDFENLNPEHYWSGTVYGGSHLFAWNFNFELGRQEAYKKTDYADVAMALYTADISQVPLPAASLFLFSGVLALLSIRFKTYRAVS